MIPIVRIVMLAFVACILLTWLLRRWDFVQSIGVLLCFFWMGMLVGQNVERPYRYQRKVELPTEKRSFSHMERVQQRCLYYRRELLDRYRTQTAEEEQFAVLAAMTLGDKSALTKELRETYSVTGASHILALSGLHLGIIYLLLFRLTLGRRRSWLSQVVIILSIWAFAFLTGLSTSVIRSATMISIYALFSVGGRHRSPVNILCFTAIVMLLVNPASLFDIGFQLSFSAVLAILLLMPLFESFFPEHYFEGRPLQHYIYNMVGLSVAAQVGVAPLIAFYFGRFSTYFLLTNFIVIPAATMILYGALLVVMIPSLAPVLLDFVGILNKALGWVSQMPCASIDGLHPSVLQICLLYVVFFCVYFSLRILQRVPPIT
jgi:competence protein ComEC